MTSADERYGYNDRKFVHKDSWNKNKVFSLIFALAFICAIWLFLDAKLLFGEDWISATYDHENWRTNEGFLRTLGAWDVETHIWKSVFIMDNFPNFHWNPYWYLGMPLLEYYQPGFNIAHIAVMLITGLSPGKAALQLVIFAHLLATLLTFLLCYKVSRKIWVSALSSIFLLASTFMSLRSYGWEPISVVFLFFYPLGLLIFLRKPTKPFRFWLIVTLTIAYLMHPLLFFSLAMFMGLYLGSIAMRPHKLDPGAKHKPYIIEYFFTVFTAILLGAVQFVPQFLYHQVTSGAHMGVSYIPFYHVPFNIISLKDFFLDAGNLKGPGLSIMVAFALFLLFAFYELKHKGNVKNKFFSNYIVTGTFMVLAVMVMFYYMEKFNIFPMNMLRSIQYHRIIPEFIITAAVFIAALSNSINNKKQRILYYAILLSFSLASLIVIYNVQTNWQTVDSIADTQEFVYEEFPGRMSMPYIDQSLSVRNSFTNQYQTYGYYEQGITNAYLDEVFSVSSGFHSADISLVYLKAANVGRLYINTEEGERNKKTFRIFDGVLPFHHKEGDRYAYFEIELDDPDYAEAISINDARELETVHPGCRIMFKEHYCGSEREEFVTKDLAELRYLEAYLQALAKPIEAEADYELINPHKYELTVRNADEQTAVVVKMNYDSNFKAFVEKQEVEITQIGPDFMLIHPNKPGDYTITLQYSLSKKVVVGGIISAISIVIFLLYFIFKPNLIGRKSKFREGDMKWA